MLAELINKSADEEAPATLIAMRCLRHRNRDSTCSRCGAACPEKAIQIDTTVRINAGKCSGCLACAAVCPTEALEPPPSAYSFRHAMLPAGKPILKVACSENYFTTPDITLPCLAGLSDHDLAAFLLLSEREVRFHLDSCQECPKRKAMPAWEQRTQNLAQKLPALKARLRSITEKPVQHGNAERRAFFTLLGRSTLQSARLLLQAENGTDVKPPAGKHLPARIRYLRQVLQRLEDKTHQWRVEALFPDLRFHEPCNQCGRCVGSCPTGAIKVQKDSEARIIHRREQCCGCGLCVDICPLKAASFISRGSSLPLSGMGRDSGPHNG